MLLVYNCFAAQNVELVQDARAARAWRDEADMLRERAVKVDTLEAEVARYKDKIADIQFYKTRAEELREDNKWVQRGRTASGCRGGGQRVGVEGEDNKWV